MSTLFRQALKRSRILNPSSVSCHVITRQKSTKLRHSNIIYTELRETVTEKHATERIKKLQTYSPHSLSVKELLSFPSLENPEERSFIFLRRQLLIRLANIIREIECLPESFRQQPSFIQCQDWYWQSFRDILRFEDVEARDANNQEEFTKCLQKVVQRHSSVVETMAHAVLEYKRVKLAEAQSKQRLPRAGNSNKTKTSVNGQIHYVRDPNYEKTKEFNKELTKFLDRFFMSRIGIRLLLNQHLSLFGDKSDGDHKIRVGAFNKEMRVTGVVEQAYDDARFLCEKVYFDFDPPELILEEINSTSHPDNSAFSIGYIPSHLHHICFEIFKNSQRASIDQAIKSNQDDPNPIKVGIYAGQSEITIKIEDRGGGASKETAERWFDYLYTTAPKPETDSAPQQQDAPMAGYGVGLPISRLYARYLSGGLEVMPIEGNGTIVYIYLKRNSDEAREVLPNYVDRLDRDYEGTFSGEEKWIGKW